MYYFVFYYMYRFQQSRTDAFMARYLASLAVMVTILFHTFFVLSCVRFFFDYEEKLFQFAENKNLNKLILIIIGVLGILFSNLYYNKTKANEIIDFYENKTHHIFSIKNTIAFLLIVLAPLIIGIFLLNNSYMVTNSL